MHDYEFHNPKVVTLCLIRPYSCYPLFCYLVDEDDFILPQTSNFYIPSTRGNWNIEDEQVRYLILNISIYIFCLFVCFFVTAKPIGPKFLLDIT